MAKGTLIERIAEAKRREEEAKSRTSAPENKKAQEPEDKSGENVAAVSETGEDDGAEKPRRVRKARK